MRLDLIVSERLGVSRTRAQNVIKTGGVSLRGEILDKPSLDIDPDPDLAITDTLRYASLGGVKMEHALDFFHLDIRDKVCLDVGAANGGFTDCLVKKAAKEVDALDLNIAFPAHLLSDKRVIIHDKTNVKSVGDLFSKDKFDLITVDLSFISLIGLMPLFYPLIKKEGALLLLFKPQFEVGRKFLPKSGIVRDKKAIDKALASVIAAAENVGFKMIGHCPVPDIFPDKNKERTILFIKQ